MGMVRSVTVVVLYCVPINAVRRCGIGMRRLCSAHETRLSVEQMVKNENNSESQLAGGMQSSQGSQLDILHHDFSCCS